MTTPATPWHGPHVGCPCMPGPSSFFRMSGAAQHHLDFDEPDRASNNDPHLCGYSVCFTPPNPVANNQLDQCIVSLGRIDSALSAIRDSTSLVTTAARSSAPSARRLATIAPCRRLLHGFLSVEGLSAPRAALNEREHHGLQLRRRRRPGARSSPQPAHTSLQRPRPSADAARFVPPFRHHAVAPISERPLESGEHAVMLPLDPSASTNPQRTSQRFYQEASGQAMTPATPSGNASPRFSHLAPRSGSPAHSGGSLAAEQRSERRQYRGRVHVLHTLLQP